MKFTSALLTTASGKLGGAVASKARGGVKYFRALVTPSNPRTGPQSTVRLILSATAAAWRSTLNNVQRAAWSALAGSTESGIDAYVKVNSQVALTGQPRVDDAPASISLPAALLTDISIDRSDNAIKFTAADGYDDLYVNVFASSQQMSPSRQAQEFPFTFVGSVHVDSAGATTQSLAAFPALSSPTVGRVIFVKFVQVDVSGKVAVPQIQRCIVVA